MPESAAGDSGGASIEVVEPLPQLRIRLSKTDPDSPIALVDGMTTSVAMEIPWDDIWDTIKKVGELILGASGGEGCVTLKITTPDGSVLNLEQCPPPKPT